MIKKCLICNEDLDTTIPWQCKYCGEYFCSNHRLPENHNCKKYYPHSWKNKEYIYRGTTPENVSMRDWLEAPYTEPIREKEKKVIRTSKVKSNKLNKKIVVGFIGIFLLSFLSVFGYTYLNNYNSQLEIDIENLSLEIEDGINILNNANNEFTNSELLLNKYSQYLDENESELNDIINGDEFFLHNPTYSELTDFIKKDRSNNEKSMVENAKKQGMRCAYVRVDVLFGAYPLVGFDTIEKGMIYYEASTDYRVYPEIGSSYVDCVEGSPYYAEEDDTIEGIRLYW